MQPPASKLLLNSFSKKESKWINDDSQLLVCVKHTVNRVRSISKPCGTPDHLIMLSIMSVNF